MKNAPIFAAAAVAPALGYAIAVAMDLDYAETRLLVATPPEHVAAALADVKRRAGDIEQRRRTSPEGGTHPVLVAYRQVFDEMVQGTWRP